MKKITVEWIEFNEVCELETKSEIIESAEKLDEFIGDLERTSNFYKITNVKEEK